MRERDREIDRRPFELAVCMSSKTHLPLRFYYPLSCHAPYPNSFISPSPQILLVGPPFKSLDSRFRQPDFHVTSGQRVFLYNRQMFVENVDVKDTRLPPFDFTTPAPEPDVKEAKEVSEHLLSLSPLRRALFDFDKRFLANLRKGEALLDTSERCLVSARVCMEEQGVQRDALEAALRLVS